MEAIEVRWVGELSKVRVEPGDLFVFRVDAHMTIDQVDRLSAQVRERLGDVKVLVLSRGLSLDVRALAAAEEAKRRTHSAIGWIRRNVRIRGFWSRVWSSAR